MRHSLLSRSLSIVALLAIVFVIPGCETYQDVEFMGVSNWKIIDYDTDGIEAEFDAKVKNPNGYAIKVKGSDIDLYINKDRLGKARITNTVKLKRKTTGTYTIRMKSKFDKVGGSLLSMGKSLFGGSINVRAKGWVKGSAFMISRKVPFDVSEDVKPEGGMFGK